MNSKLAYLILETFKKDNHILSLEEVKKMVLISTETLQGEVYAIHLRNATYLAYVEVSMYGDSDSVNGYFGANPTYKILTKCIPLSCLTS